MVSEISIQSCVDSGPMVRQNVMAAGAYGRGGYSLHDGQEAERRQRLEAKYNLQSHAPVTYFLQLLKFLQTPKIQHLQRMKHSTREPVGDISYSHHSTILLF
jgi:hypothetical protein